VTLLHSAPDDLSLENAVEENIASALRLHWSPAEWGRTTFDVAMIHAIRTFQQRRFLPDTGMVDARTMQLRRTFRPDPEMIAPSMRFEKFLDDSCVPTPDDPFEDVLATLRSGLLVRFRDEGIAV